MAIFNNISDIPIEGFGLDMKCSTNNKAVVVALYKTLEKGEGLETVSKLLASDLEWWFHGPPHRQHMMRVLTGDAEFEFKFEPRSIEVVGGHVIAEGWEGAKTYWVHVWTVEDGLITQFREYFNTWLIVKDVKRGGKSQGDSRIFGQPRCVTLWQSQPEDLCDRSLPGLLIAI